MSDVNDEQIPAAPDGVSGDDVIPGDGSGDPNSDRQFLQDQPPAQDKRLDDAEVDVTDADDDEGGAFAEE
ncbi:hypothetical protein [Microbacterium sp. 179-I 3D4 NHS]|uniref:hypothetical protein n=1 Tax=Microbacterium sp. 179-I 3D4 NHS TaxID=3142381 RepID=UPI0039A198C7